MKIKALLKALKEGVERYKTHAEKKGGQWRFSITKMHFYGETGIARVKKALAYTKGLLDKADAKRTDKEEEEYKAQVLLLAHALYHCKSSGLGSLRCYLTAALDGLGENIVPEISFFWGVDDVRTTHCDTIFGEGKLKKQAEAVWKSRLMVNDFYEAAEKAHEKLIDDEFDAASSKCWDLEGTRKRAKALISNLDTAKDRIQFELIGITPVAGSAQVAETTVSEESSYASERKP